MQIFNGAKFVDKIPMQVNIPIFMQIISKLQPHGRTLHRVPSVLLKLSHGWQERDPAQKTHKIPIPQSFFGWRKLRVTSKPKFTWNIATSDISIIKIM